MISLAKQRKALEAIQKALIDAGEDPQEVAHLIDTLQRRPLLRFFVLLKVEDEARARVPGSIRAGSHRLGRDRRLPRENRADHHGNHQAVPVILWGIAR